MSEDLNAFDFELELKSSHFPNGDIVLETVKIDPVSRVARTVSCHLVQTRDAQTRKSLIALGWKPPGELDSYRSELISLGWTPPGERPGRRVVAGRGLTGGGSDPREVRGPIGSSYPLAYRLVATGDGNGNDVLTLQGLHIVGSQRRWADLLTQDSVFARDSIPSFLPI